MLMMFKLVILCMLLTFSHAITVPLRSRDVIDPPITSPTKGTVWMSGQTVTVTWNTSNIPPPSNVSNPTGTLVLGFLTSDSENLMLDTPLASNFPLSKGSITIKVPSVPTRNNYIVVLMGSSGNASPEFTIEGPTSTSSTSVKAIASSISSSNTRQSIGLSSSSTKVSSVSPSSLSATPTSPSVTFSSSVVASLPDSALPTASSSITGGAHRPPLIRGWLVALFLMVLCML